DMVMFMGTKPGARAENVHLRLPTTAPGHEAHLLTADEVRPLPIARREAGWVEVTVPSLSDGFNAVIVTEGTYPFLAPETRLVRCKTGERVELRVDLLDAMGRKLTGTLRVHAPPEWAAPQPSSWKVDLAPGEATEKRCALSVPPDAIRRPHFLRLECSGLVQRVMLFPENGKPQRFSDLDPDDLPVPARTPAAPAARPPMGETWLEVVADDRRSDSVAAHRPGVCFLPGREWDPPTMHEGKMARYGERIPRLGSPNFLVNDPSDRDIEVRLTYWTQSGGTMNVYDGRQYRKVADLTETGRWATATGRVEGAILADPRAERAPYPGTNIMFDVNCTSVYIHKIEVRALPRN
ncbi:MAG: hypothetical protein ACE5JM_15825, partial [Armatimonadota bacterium]